MNLHRTLWELNQTPYGFFHDDIDASLFHEIHKRIKKLGKPVSVLDLGCGKGEVTKLLLPISKTVSSVDFSEVAIRNCRKHIKNKKASFFVDSIEGFLDETKQKYDVIILCRSLYTRKPKRTLEKVHEHLTESGILILVNPKKAIFEYSKTDAGFSPKLFIKGIVPRVPHWVRFVDYNLIQKDKMVSMLQEYFSKINSEDCGRGTHYIIIAKK